MVFDQSLRWAEFVNDAAIRQAFLSFPVRNLQPVEGVPDDFPVRFVPATLPAVRRKCKSYGGAD